MFSPTQIPRVFGVPLGLDFSQQLYNGLIDRFAQHTPAEMAAAVIYVNTRRMQRRLTDLFHQGPAVLLPQIRLVTDLGKSSGLQDIPAAVSPLRRRLEVAQLVKGLIEADPTLASKDSAFDLADSLVDLMAEMQGEGVPASAIHGLDVTDQSGHWARALGFINLVHDVFDQSDAPDPEGRQRRVIETQIEHWATEPPHHPIIVAGSTGSRGATSLFMQSVAKLPQGAVILPGIDRDLPDHVWAALDPENGGEDHPQYRFKALWDALGLSAANIRNWSKTPAPNPDRTALVSLSLRPAPVTDQWIKDGAQLQDLHAATQGLTLIEAPTPRAEADAIAVRLRQAVEDGQTAALITPDRMLTRQVSAALDRWDITPDDSAGLPLQLTATGRFLRHITDLFCAPLDAENLLVMLRHPLTHSGGDDRGSHNLCTNALELHLRRFGPPFPTPQSLSDWADKKADKHPDRADWAAWMSRNLFGFDLDKPLPLSDHIARHIDVAERLSAGPDADATGALWKEAAGREALRVMSELRTHAEAGGVMSAREYRQLVGNILSAGEVRNPDSGHPHVLIWGTLEARVQSADLVILGGMNEGTWPNAPAPDPWLNRPLRLQAGLLLPERRIGLSAHDYQQAISATDVVISRAIRSDEAETVPSRWVNRLSNLLGGLDVQGGKDRLEDMRARGRHWLDVAATIAAPIDDVPAAKRPSPCPPTVARPNMLSVTQIKTLIRDPYAIYARNILGLYALDPLAHTADAPLRGIIVHEILEKFVRNGVDPAGDKAAEILMTLADDVLAEHCPWPSMRALWRARISTFAPHFLAEEIKRQKGATNIGTELKGELFLPSIPFTLKGTADRIDKTDAGEALIYDYKTGKAPTKDQQLHFDKQLLLEAAMVERGAFKTVGAARTNAAVYIGLGADLKDQIAPLDKSPPDETLDRFEGLIRKWMDPERGYTSRRAVETQKFEGNYDHLARYGEWDETSDPHAEDLS